MSDSTEVIFAEAKQRAEQMQLPYAGALTPDEAHELHGAGVATLVDVRTVAELGYVGGVADAQTVEWQSYPTMQVNDHFIEELQAVAAVDSPVLFLCRSGVRSHYAATVAAEHGYRAYNILEGFEGDLDADGHRNTVNGWRARRLPWVQS